MKNFDYVDALKEGVKKIAPPELLADLKKYDCGFKKHIRQQPREKVHNSRIILEYERGGEENSYINIFVGDYDNLYNDRREKIQPDLVGYFYIKDYFQETEKIFKFMYYLQLAAQKLADAIFWDEI